MNLFDECLIESASRINIPKTVSATLIITFKFFNQSIEHVQTFRQTARSMLYVLWNSWKIFLKLCDAISGPNFQPY